MWLLFALIFCGQSLTISTIITMNASAPSNSPLSVIMISLPSGTVTPLVPSLGDFDLIMAGSSVLVPEHSTLYILTVNDTRSFFLVKVNYELKAYVSLDLGL